MHDIKLLFDKYLKGACTSEEIAILLKHFELTGEQSQLSEKIEVELDRIIAEAEDTAEVRALLARNHSAVMNKVRRQTKTVPLYIKLIAAACIVLAAGFILSIFLRQSLPVDNTTISANGLDLLPGSNRATLTLSDGRNIALSSAELGRLTSDRGSQIEKISDGLISYTTDPQKNPSSISSLYNTVTTPKGGQFAVVLPDGSKVWLNAASSLKYPASFTGSREREVELDGEAYFEIAHNKAMPFIVKTSSQAVQVLGTHFNINSYQNEGRTITTLLEGKVSVQTLATSPRDHTQSLILVPGQQSINTAHKLIAQAVDAETAVAWKNGLFKFSEATIETVMRQVSRWYDVEIKYNGPVTRKLFSGGIERNAKLSTVLKIFKASGIRFSISEEDGRKILTVSP